MKNIFLKTVLAAAVVLAFAFSTAMAADGADPTYVGANKCKICHKGDKNGNIYETWEGSAHAKAMDVLVEKGEQENPECLGCHTTGYDKGGYGAEGMETVKLGFVGCEACHGAGSDYKSKKVMVDHEASIAAGLVMPDESTCTVCHNENSPTFKGFNFEESWAKIMHAVPVAEAEAEAEAEGE